MSSNLTEDQKLVMLGLRSPNQQSSSTSHSISLFKSNIASAWDTFQEHFEDAGLTTWVGFEDWLISNGIGKSTAKSVRNNYESNFSSWSAFSDHVLTSTSWSEYRNAFRSGSGLRSDISTDSGLPAAGIRVFEESGVGRAGQPIAEGGLELWGTEIHTSESATVVQAAEDQSANPITYANLSISNTTPIIFTEIDVSADVTNNTSISNIPAVVELLVDGEVVQLKTVYIDANSTTSVTFTIEFDAYESHEVTIASLSTQTVTVVHPGLVS